MVISSTVLAMFLYHFALPQPKVPVNQTSVSQSEETLSVHSFFGDGTSLSIPQGGQRIVMLTLNMKAKCSADVSVHSINLQRKGLGDRNDITALYAVSGSNRLSRPRTISRKNGKVQLRFRNLTIAACQEKTVQILADFSDESGVGGEHRMILEGQSPINAGGATVIITASRVPTVSRTTGFQSSSITVEHISTGNRIRYGAQRIVGKFRLQADRRGSHAISAIRVTNNGSARNEDLQNLYLETSTFGRISSIVPQMEGDTIFFKIEPALLLRRGRSRTIQIRADVRSGAQKTIDLRIEESSDVVATPARRIQ